MGMELGWGGEGMKPNKTKDACPSCGVKWIDHKGLEHTCLALKAALAVLKKISRTPRNKGARRRATVTVELLELFKCP